MSHVKLFSTITDSSVWDYPDRVCKIWITLLAMADWHGCVYASLPGVANRSRKTVEEVEEALAIFRAPDKYSRSQEHEGRRLVDIDGGWMLLTYKKHREAKNAEALREQKREWAAADRARRKANGVEESRTNVEEDRTTTNEHRKNDSVVSVLDLKSDPDPEGVQGEDELDAAAAEYIEDMATAEVFDKAVVWDGGPVLPEDEPQEAPSSEFDAVDVPVIRRQVRALPEDWQPSDALIAAASAAGLTREYFLERIADLRLGPIGGTRGVFESKIDDYIRKLLPKWRIWLEIEQAKAPGKPNHPKLMGMPPWVRKEHEEFATVHGLQLQREVQRFAKGHHIHPDNLDRVIAATAFAAFLQRRRGECRETSATKN